MFDLVVAGAEAVGEEAGEGHQVQEGLPHGVQAGAHGQPPGEQR